MYYSELFVVYVYETRAHIYGIFKAIIWFGMRLRVCCVVNLQVYENCLLKFDITKRLKFKLLVQERGLSECVYRIYAYGEMKVKTARVTLLKYDPRYGNMCRSRRRNKKNVY